MTAFKDNALLYFNKGLLPVPLNGKAPFLENWGSLEITEDIVLEWIEKYPNNNIGIIMGSRTGLIGLDIDTDDSEVLKNAPLSPVVKRGAKGETRFFRYNNEISSSKKPIDILSSGRQSAMPPSIHPDTSLPYTWISSHTLLSIDLDLLPELDRAYLEGLQVTFSNETGGRHNTLFEITSAMLGRNEDVSTILKEIIEYDLANHNPPYFTDKTQKHHKGTGQLAALNMITSCAKTIFNRHGNLSLIDYSSSSSNIVFDANVDTESKTQWKKLPKLEGVGKEIFNDIYNNSPVPRSQFAFMASMSLISVCIGNKLFLKGTGANLYLYSLGNSGMGKDFPMKRIQQYIIKSEMDTLLGTSSPTSESLVMKVLSDSRESIFFVNEAESLLKRISNDSTNNGVKECLTAIFESSGKSVLPKKILKQTKDGVAIDIIGRVFSPYLNLYLSSTVDAFREYGKKSMFSTGFGARFLYYFEDRRKKAKILDTYNPPANNKIIDILKVIRSHGSFIDVDPNAEISTNEALLKDEAKSELNRCLELIQEELYNTKDESFIEVISRKPMYLNKFTLIHHVMLNPTDYIYTHVEKISVTWAFEAIEATYHNMIINLRENVSSSDYEKKYNDMISFIKKRTDKKKPTAKKELSARFVYDPTLRSKILKELIDSETIILDKDKKLWFNKVK